MLRERTAKVPESATTAAANECRTILIRHHPHQFAGSALQPLRHPEFLLTLVMFTSSTFTRRRGCLAQGIASDLRLIRSSIVRRRGNSSAAGSSASSIRRRPTGTGREHATTNGVGLLSWERMLTLARGRARTHACRCSRAWRTNWRTCAGLRGGSGGHWRHRTASWTRPRPVSTPRSSNTYLYETVRISSRMHGTGSSTGLLFPRSSVCVLR